MATDHRDQHIAGPHAFFDGFYKINTQIQAIHIHEDLILREVRYKVVIQASRRIRGVIATITDEDLPAHLVAMGLTHRLRSISNPLHVLQEHFLPTTIIEFRGPAIGMAGDPLSGFKGTVIFQKVRDTRSPK